MATTADTSRDAQAVIAIQAARLAAKGWPEVDLAALKTSLPSFKQSVAAAVRHYSPAAATAALRYYLERRAAAGLAGSPRFNTAPSPALGQIGAGVDWAAEPLWGKSDLPAAERRLEAVVERLVLNTGRDTIVGAVEQDRKAQAWARVPEAGCCSWCAMIATRGAVYGSARAAGEDHAYHNHCRCHVEPVFTAYEPSAQVRQWQGEWTRLKTHLGASPSPNEWRQFFEAGFPVL